MQIEVRLLARLFRLPLLRIDGFVVLRDDAPTMTLSVRSPGPASVPRELSPRGGPADGDRHRVGRDLAEAEAILSGLDG